MVSPIVVVSNQKGGVWKTTVCQALLDGMVADGYAARAVDLDPQSNLSEAAGYGQDVPSMFDVAHGLASASSWPVGTCAAARPGDLIELRDRELGRALPLGALRDVLHRVQDETEGCAPVVIDTPPSLDLLVTAGLMAADFVVIPTSMSLFSSSGLARDLDFVRGAFGDCGREVSERTVGILITGYNTGSFATNLADVAQSTYPEEGLHVFRTRITRGGRVEELQARGERILTGRRGLRSGLRRYREFVSEAERWLRLPAV